MKYVKRSLASDEQIRAINFGEGNAIVIAGPGSGKTFVLTQRIRTLIESFDVNPANILTITFTKAAAKEMQSRFIRLTNAGYPEVTFGTFHSVFYRINRMADATYPNRLMTNTDKRTFMNGVLKTFGIRTTGDVASLYLTHLSLEKNTGHAVMEGRDVLPGAERYDDIMMLYQELVRDAGRIDFDDMASDCYRILSRNERALSMFRNRFRYLLVDEFQDINNTQYETIRLLAGDAANANLFVVGDDDQSIYGFRGSDPSFMHRFPNDYPDCKVFLLTGNFRSDISIVQASKTVIAENENRFPKELRAAGEHRDTEGAGVYTDTYASANEEYEAIVDRIGKEAESVSFGNFAVLMRTNSELSRFAQYLMTKRIPFYIREKVTLLYEEETAKDLLAYLAFSCGERTPDDFIRIMNKPLRYFSRASVRDAGKHPVTKEHLLAYYAGKPYMHDTIHRLFGVLDRASKMRTDLALRYLAHATGYEQYVRQTHGEEGIRLFHTVLSDMLEDAVHYRNHEEFIAYTKSRNDRGHRSLLASAQKENKNSAVGLVTIHAAKGLEYDTVFLPFLNEGMIPSRAATSDEEIAEERRMLYVAMTRAKRRLYLSYQTGSDGKSRMPSRLIKPILYLWKE